MAGRAAGETWPRMRVKPPCPGPEFAGARAPQAPITRTSAPRPGWGLLAEGSICEGSWHWVSCVAQVNRELQTPRGSGHLSTAAAGEGGVGLGAWKKPPEKRKFKCGGEAVIASEASGDVASSLETMWQELNNVAHGDRVATEVSKAEPHL